MELEVKRNRFRLSNMFTGSGIISFLIGIIILVMVNIGLLTGFHIAFGSFTLALLGIFLGIFGLFTNRSNRLYAYWGLGLNVFILIFAFLMFVFAWSINAKP
ncbi:hypothetical protein [Sutcliffiella sp. NC1]|uniref:hypothetical protein n=1 Tax=Sutcliffiella sp. NC1 TaxID=3004096 RepID=UPI0022DD1167|nr:hypothetical protein [Sutcliffiella sp. NC1]WBL16906.1 hypothetical protein O1A01_09845 [Sutcliffiella sp. NC1]